MTPIFHGKLLKFLSQNCMLQTVLLCINEVCLQVSFCVWYAWGHYKTTLYTMCKSIPSPKIRQSYVEGGSRVLVASSKSDILGGKIPLEVDILLVLLKVSHTAHEMRKPSKLTDLTLCWYPTNVCTGSCVKH